MVLLTIVDHAVFDSVFRTTGRSRSRSKFDIDREGVSSPSLHVMDYPFLLSTLFGTNFKSGTRTGKTDLKLEEEVSLS